MSRAILAAELPWFEIWACQSAWLYLGIAFGARGPRGQA